MTSVQDRSDLKQSGQYGQILRFNPAPSIRDAIEDGVDSAHGQLSPTRVRKEAAEVFMRLEATLVHSE